MQREGVEERRKHGRGEETAGHDGRNEQTEQRKGKGEKIIFNMFSYLNLLSASSNPLNRTG